MAIVEDEVRNESEEENEIEVVVEDDDGEQDSGDDDSEDDDEDEALETKVAELERRIAEDPYNYDDHIELIQSLWGLSELDRWQAAFEQLHQISLLRAEHWLLRLQTEVSLAHSPQARERVSCLFQMAALDCYSIPILSEWCSWSLGAGDVEAARAQLDEVSRRAGADPLSGKLFWDARAELEKSQLDNLSEDDPDYKKQAGRVLFCLEEIVSRPLLHGEEAWPQLEELATKIHDTQLLDTAKTQHAAAVDFLQKITPYEDRLLTMEDPEEKCKVYQEYIDKVKDLAEDKKFLDCDCDGILRVLYDRVTSECLQCAASYELLRAFAAHAQQRSSRATYWRVLCACARRCPRRAAFWLQQMTHREREGATFDEIKSLLESALSKGMDHYKDTESLWMGYLEYMRRHTAFDNEEEVERLRRTFRLAWDSLAETWGAEANDCEVPMFWARLEYKRMGDHKQGKEIFEEIFKYGENKTMSKYWEAFIHLETTRSPPPSENKIRDLHKRALKFVTDYPPAIARLYTDLERDVGSVETMRQCLEDCEIKLKEWRDSYQAMKDKMIGNKQKGKQAQSKKSKLDKKQNAKPEETTPSQQNKNTSKRKADDEKQGGSEVKKKKDSAMDVQEWEKEANTSASSLKRAHGDYSQEADSKRQRRDSSSGPQDEKSREACTLFVSNLEFKVNEQNLRDKLAEFGDIIALRVKAGVKAFGGSICYCQYKTPESVDEAVKHDRTPLDGRPMFLSHYSAKKDGKGRSFKYPTEVTEKNKLFVKNLPYEHCTREALEAVFDKFGKLRDVRPVTHKDGKPKGLAYIEYEDDASAAHALEKTNGLLLGDRNLVVALSAPPPKKDGAASASLGQAKREPGGALRRTQLSSFIPSVLLKPSTSKANGNTSTEEKRPLSNSDFRTLLLKK